MNSKEISYEEIKNNSEVHQAAPTVDDFIRELEEKEKDLDISSDLVIEVGESEVEHDNIHDSFVPNKTFEPDSYENSASGNAFIKSFEPPAEAETYSDLQGKVALLTGERDELKSSILRRQSDFDNYRKRIERERSETFKNILGKLAGQMLPVLDNLNRALDSTETAESKNQEGDFQTLLEGIVLVNQQLNDVLAEMGVQQIPAVGQPFDPNFHEAVASEETDEFPHKTVIGELLKGYRIDDKIIRASMVKVSSSSAKKQMPLIIE